MTSSSSSSISLKSSFLFGNMFLMTFSLLAGTILGFSTVLFYFASSFFYFSINFTEETEGISS